MDCHIDQDKLKLYLETRCQQDQEIIQRVVNHTRYFTTNEMLAGLLTALQQYTQLFPKYNLFIPSTNFKIGSDHFIIWSLRDILNPVTVIYDYDIQPDNDYPILILDDAIYSGCHICSLIDGYYDEEEKYHTLTLLKNPCHVVVFVASTCDHPITRRYNVTIFAIHEFEELQCLNLFKDIDSEYIYKQFQIQCERALPIYFEHKIANNFGSWQFYHDIIKNPISRSRIDAITSDDINLLIKSWRS